MTGKSILLTTLLGIGIFCTATAQNKQSMYSHKIIVDSVFQTKAYTYLKVREQLTDKDALVWMALPVIPAKTGDIYYYEGGMEMGEFHSKELNRTFSQILFLGAISTSAEMSEKTLIPEQQVDTVRDDAPAPELHTVTVKEVLQAGGYTYLRVKEGNKDEWLAVVKVSAKPGQVYTYDDAAPMKNFHSKELNRTFDEVLFIAKLTPVLADGSDQSKEKKKGKK